MLLCELCNLNFKRTYDFNRHLKCSKHFNNKHPFYKLGNDDGDGDCNKKNLLTVSSDSLQTLTNFENVESNKENYQCKLCNKKYVRKFYYDEHVKNCLGNNKIIEERITVINIKTNIIKYGKNAPLKSKLDSFLINNPDYEIYKKNNNSNWEHKKELNIVKKKLNKLINDVNNLLEK